MTRRREVPGRHRPLIRAASKSGMVAALLAVGALLLLAGCASVGRLYQRESRPGRTKLSSRLIVIPAQIVGTHFVIETTWDKHGPWRFLVDTGSSVTLVSPAFASRYGFKQEPTNNPPVLIRSANGGTISLPAAHIRRLELAEASFLNVSVFVHDCAELSAHLGMRIDGVLGFALFRDVVFALDYPQSRLVITTAGETPLLPGSTIEFNNRLRTPIIPLRLGEESFIALIDSGSDGPLVLNPFGLRPDFDHGPRTGGTVGTLSGERAQQIGRLKTPLILGDYQLARPIVDLTDQLSSIGGEVLRHFCVTFDPPRNRVTFHRDTTAPIITGPKRSTGLSFIKTPAYWRVASVIPGSPAEALGIDPGALIARINGEPVSAWPLPRLETLTRRASDITFTFIEGAVETPVIVPTFELIPR